MKNINYINYAFVQGFFSVRIALYYLTSFQVRCIKCTRFVVWCTPLGRPEGCSRR